VVVLAVLLPSTPWCIPHLGVSCIDHNSSKIGAITHNSNCSNFSNNSCSSNSTMLLPYRHSRLPLGLHSNCPPATFNASTVGRWATLLENASSPSKATHRELRQLWSFSRGAIRRVMYHRQVVPTTPLWWRFPWEKR
jgi:hypothetical protein